MAGDRTELDNPPSTTHKFVFERDATDPASLQPRLVIPIEVGELRRMIDGVSDGDVIELHYEFTH